MDHFGQNLHIKEHHLYWENDHLFFLLADTLWYGLTKRCSEAEFEEIILDRKQKGFTAIQLVVGVPPEVDIFDENAKSTHGHFAFNPDFTINDRYFDDIVKKVDLVVKHKLVPIVYGSWGNHIDTVGITGMKDLWTHMIKRFENYPVIYSLCGEVDIFPTNTNAKHPLLIRIIRKIPILKRILRKIQFLIHTRGRSERIQKWAEVAKHIVVLNTAKHPLTVHINSPQLATQVFAYDNSWIDIDSFQSGHGMEGFEMMGNMFEKLQKNDRAFVNLEPLYEGILNQTDTRFQNYSFWKSVSLGAVGHVYGANGLWQMAQHDRFLPHWGEAEWDMALQYPGGTALGKAKKWIEDSKFQWNARPANNTSFSISYIKNPLLSEVFMRDRNRVICYIPCPDCIDSIKYGSNTTATFEVYDALSYNKIEPSRPTQDLDIIKKYKKELLIALNVV